MAVDIGYFQSLLSSSNLVRYVCCDLNGIARGHVMPTKSAISQHSNGLPVYAGILTLGPRSEVAMSIKAINDISHGNVLLVPQIETIMDVTANKSTRDIGVKQFLSEVYWMDGSPMNACPRRVARNVLKRLNDKHGYKVLSGFESEFYVCNPQTQQPIFQATKLCSHDENCLHENFLHGISMALPNSCSYLKVETFDGLLEIPLIAKEGLKGADDMFLLRSTITEVCKDFPEKVATFLPCPFPDIKTNAGGHFNFSLWSGDRNVFYSKSGKENLSEIGKSFLAGILLHAPALTALCCPTLNCYYRLHQPWAPTKSTWGIDDRFASLRVKNVGEKGTYFENRIPSSACNPYLVMAATLSAGLEGIENEISLQEVDANAKLPSSMSEALDLLESDSSVFKRYMGAEVIDWYIGIKRELELNPLSEKSREELCDYYFSAI